MRLLPKHPPLELREPGTQSGCVGEHSAAELQLFSLPTNSAETASERKVPPGQRPYHAHLETLPEDRGSSLASSDDEGQADRGQLLLRIGQSARRRVNIPCSSAIASARRPTASPVRQGPSHSLAREARFSVNGRHQCSESGRALGQHSCDAHLRSLNPASARSRPEAFGEGAQKSRAASRTSKRIERIIYAPCASRSCSAVLSWIATRRFSMTVGRA
jgi:hypothetical protein